MFSASKDLPIATSLIVMLAVIHLMILAFAIWFAYGWASEQLSLPDMPFQVAMAFAYIISSLAPSKSKS